jgi:hypothetical protein
MMIVKADKSSEAGILPNEKMLADMGKFNEEMVKAGVMLAGEGLQASSKGARVRFSKGRPTVTDGPFSEAKELVALAHSGEVEGRGAQWAKRVPFERAGSRSARCSRLEDFGQARQSAARPAPTDYRKS